MSPKAAKSDSTLLAVLFLDLFEKITNQDSRSSDSWMSHVHGALALSKLRGSRQLYNEIGVRLAVRLSTNLVISCVASHNPVPQGVINLRSELVQIIGKNDPKWHLTGLCIEYANLAAAVREKGLPNSFDVADAIELDKRSSLCRESFPPTFHYTRSWNIEHPERILEQHIDTYRDHTVTQVWNVLRIMRILLLDIIRQYHNKPPEPYSEHTPPSYDLDTCNTVIDEQVREICATIPQFTLKHRNTARDPAMLQLQCYTLLFPLYVAAQFAPPGSSVQPWTIKQLRLIASEFCLPKAYVIVDMLERGSGNNP